MDVVPIGLFLIGACIGSFLNVVILRYCASLTEATRKFDVRGRSYCPTCQRQLRWWELIPILSFTFLRGRCHRCHTQISVQYPAVELGMGLLMVAVVLPLPFNVSGAVLIILNILIAALLLVLFVIDLKTMLLPDIFVGLLLAVVLARQGMIYNQSPLTYSLSDSLYGVAVGAGFLLLLWLVTRGRGIGLGDVKLMVPLGLWAGLPGTITLLFIAYMAGGGLAFYLLAKKKASLKSAMPFGPFLCGAAVLLLLYPALPEYLLTLIFGYNPWG